MVTCSLIKQMLIINVIVGINNNRNVITIIVDCMVTLVQRKIYSPRYAAKSIGSSSICVW